MYFISIIRKIYIKKIIIIITIKQKTKKYSGSAGESGVTFNTAKQSEKRKSSYKSEEEQKYEKQIYHIQGSFRNLYRYANLLNSYAILNYTAVTKILKKHDKNNKQHKLKRRVMARIANER